ncbi:cytochrome b N-terminal domain-containing protein [Streptomyces sp. SCPE 10]|uniref:cytochrome b N-terminal domain-containing protein n=1 Tax=Streptomyces sp. SCPE 10 TaxID=3449273 RepID=UPI003F821DE4
MRSLDRRLPVSASGEEFLLKAFPEHWSFLLGESAPFSPLVSYFVLGGRFPGRAVIPRLYLAHVLLVPGLLPVLVGVHLTYVVVHKRTRWARPGRSTRNALRPRGGRSGAGRGVVSES